jgi:hypothetical protein
VYLREIFIYIYKKNFGSKLMYPFVVNFMLGQSQKQFFERLWLPSSVSSGTSKGKK